MMRCPVGPGRPDAGKAATHAWLAAGRRAWPTRRGAVAPSRNDAQNADFTTPPSTRNAAPVVADDSGLAT